VTRSNGSQAAKPHAGIRWPRAYDLLMLLLTRGRRGRYYGAVLDRAGIAPGDRVLDIGCGTGTLAIQAARRVSLAGSVAGLDVSKQMIGTARRKGRRAGVDVSFHHGDATALPFDDGSFDRVTLTTSLHMVPSSRRQQCLAEAHRVLAPGGVLLVVDYAGARDERRGWVAKHGRHGEFELHAYHTDLAEIGFVAVEGGPLDWLSLHYLRGSKEG
jgi:ubiquinone/menaquinone biosynthesis C-methylase UbiE